uniref:Uncharacterized protein n=1 Tax=Denticeps clupeoides TaxID=299321 RepID=A0AAY4D036_9TELE
MNTVLSAVCLSVLCVPCPAQASGQAGPVVPRQTVTYDGHNGVVFREKDVWNYTTMLLREDLGLLILGARGVIFGLDINNISRKKASVNWAVKEEKKKECTYKGKSSEIECENYIRVLHETEDGRMYVCGTNAFSPTCDYLTYSDGKLTLTNTEEDGKGKCPFDPFQRHSSVWLGDYHAPLWINWISRSETCIFNNNKKNIVLLSEPTFVHMNNVPASKNSSEDEKVYLFFNEFAVEYDFYSKLPVSRVARVCKGDVGGQRTLQRKWTTFMKALLKCPVMESQLPYLVQDVFRWCRDDLSSCIFYAVFTPQMGSSNSSAVCAYDTQNIEEVFSKGKFKTPASVGNSFVKWVMYTDEIPTPRPGACINEEARNMNIKSSMDLPDKTLQFIRDRPLMDQTIEPLYSRPVLVKKGPAFTRIVVDSITALDGSSYQVMFIGTESGCVLKAVDYGDQNSEEMFIIEEVQLFPSFEPIKTLRLAVSTGCLYVGSELKLVQMPLSACQRYPSCVDCVLARDPYCAWDVTAEQCIRLPASASSELIQNVTDGNPFQCPAKDLIFIEDADVHMPCQPSSNFAQLDWQRNGEPLPPSERHRLLRNVLVIGRASEEDSGLYSCWSTEQDVRILLAMYELKMDDYSRSAYHERQFQKSSLETLKVMVGLLTILVFVLSGWIFYKGYCGCLRQSRSGDPAQHEGRMFKPLRVLQHRTGKQTTPLENQNNSHTRHEEE